MAILEQRKTDGQPFELGRQGAETITARTAQPTTRLLLAAGVLAGPLYVATGLIQMAIRPGFDIRRHELSLMSNGELGWIQIANLVLAGLLSIAGAAGIRRALRSGPGRIWAPRLLAVYGLGLVAAGVFVADPMNGFPPGAPEGTGTISWHGLLHLLAGAVGFAGLISACFVMARRHAALRRRGWAVYSAATGAVFFGAFLGIAAGPHQQGAHVGFVDATFVNLAFSVAVVLGWAWISLTSAHLITELASRAPVEGIALQGRPAAPGGRGENV